MLNKKKLTKRGRKVKKSEKEKKQKVKIEEAVSLSNQTS